MSNFSVHKKRRKSDNISLPHTHHRKINTQQIVTQTQNTKRYQAHSYTDSHTLTQTHKKPKMIAIFLEIPKVWKVPTKICEKKNFSWHNWQGNRWSYLELFEEIKIPRNFLFLIKHFGCLTQHPILSPSITQSNNFLDL